MKFKCVWRKAYNVVNLGLVTLLFLLSCENHIIERAASDYFPFSEGNWWRYVSNNDTVLVKIEPPDTILQVECFPVSFGGYVKHLAKDSKAITEYINIVYNFAGDDYTIIDDFIMRIELPLVKGNAWEDSLVDSLNVSAQLIKAKYSISGRVTEYAYVDNFDCDVYTIELSTIELLTSPDTTLTDTSYVVEHYAPDIGLAQFENEDGEYTLIDYDIQ